MIDDPIVDEIHRCRQEHAAKYGNDLKTIVAAYKELERQSGKVYVAYEPKRIPVPKASDSRETYKESEG